jgi:CRISPR-associated protein Csm3
VRDSFIEEKYRTELKKNPNWTPIDLTEDKWENTINRITAKANPRNFERVIPTAKFSLNICYRVFDNLDENQKNIDEGLFAHIIDGLKLIEKDALGGAGSRGCGQIKFKLKIGDDYKELVDVTPDMFQTQLEK